MISLSETLSIEIIVGVAIGLILLGLTSIYSTRREAHNEVYELNQEIDNLRRKNRDLEGPKGGLQRKLKPILPGSSLKGLREKSKELSRAAMKRSIDSGPR